MTDLVMQIVEQTLSDGSKVYNVHFANVVLPAVTKRDATELAEKIADAINEHSVLVIDDRSF